MQHKFIKRKRAEGFIRHLKLKHRYNNFSIQKMANGWYTVYYYLK